MLTNCGALAFGDNALSCLKGQEQVLCKLFSTPVFPSFLTSSHPLLLIFLPDNGCHPGMKGAAGIWGDPGFQVLAPSRRALCLLIGVKWEHQILIGLLMESGDLEEFSSPA